MEPTYYAIQDEYGEEDYRLRCQRGDALHNCKLLVLWDLYLELRTQPVEDYLGDIPF